MYFCLQDGYISQLADATRILAVKQNFIDIILSKEYFLSSERRNQLSNLTGVQSVGCHLRFKHIDNNFEEDKRNNFRKHGRRAQGQ